MDRLLPGFAIKLGLKPRSAIDCVHKQVSYGHGDIKIRQAGLVVFRVNETKNIGMRDG